MKKLLAILLAALMLLACCSAFAEEIDADLIAAAQEEGELVVYGSCEEDYLAAATQHFEELYGIKTQYQRLSTGEVPTKIEEENGNPSADVWFGGTNNPYDDAAAKGLLDNSYVPANAAHLTKDIYKDPNGYWYGIYTGILGFMVNKDELARLGLEAPQTWDDLLKEEYKGLIWLSNYNTAGTAKLVVNTMLQMKGHDEGIQYLVDLDKNIQVYTKSGSGPSKNVGTGECVIGIGFLHDGITQIVDNGYENIQLIIPAGRHHLRDRAGGHLQGREASQRRQAVHGVRPVPRVRGAGREERLLPVPGAGQRDPAPGRHRLRPGSQPGVGRL